MGSVQFIDLPNPLGLPTAPIVLSFPSRPIYLRKTVIRVKFVGLDFF